VLLLLLISLPSMLSSIENWDSSASAAETNEREVAVDLAGEGNEAPSSSSSPRSILALGLDLVLVLLVVLTDESCITVLPDEVATAGEETGAADGVVPAAKLPLLLPARLPALLPMRLPVLLLLE